jgi:hypothetical protein
VETPKCEAQAFESPWMRRMTFLSSTNTPPNVGEV